MSTTIEPATTPAPARRGARARRLHALDGLRTIAVLLVLAYHVKLPGMHGGFLGVDIFFVLSGFLITSLLAKEIAHRGRAHLGQFWMRRVLRLLPASLLVIGAVLLWATFWAPPLQRSEIGIDALWSLLYVGNWRFIETSSYFADDGTTSPLQHVWSLAVEEQFYLLWPLLLALLAAPAVAHLRPRADAPADSALRAERTIARRRAVSAVAFTAATTLAVVSAVLLAWRYDPTAPDRAYMGTDTKAFEPLIGAAAAALVLRPRIQAWVAEHAQALIVLGLTSVVAGVALLGGEIAPQAAYFRGGAVAFALGSAVLVAATSLADRRTGLPLLLGSTPVAYVGRISYGVYLWHWPLCVWIIGDREFDAVRALAVVALTIVAAALSYHLVEYPIRTGRLHTMRPRLVLPQAAVAVGAVVLLSSQLGGSPLNTVVPAVAAAPLPTATQGDAPAANTVLVVGDSVMRRLAPQLAQTAQDRDLVVASAARGGCSALDVVVVDGSGTPNYACAQEVPATQAALVEQSRAATVVWWSRYELADRLGPDGQVLRAGTPAFWTAQREALARTVDRLTARGATLVIVEVDRVGAGIDSRCSPQDCDPLLARLRNDDAVRVAWNRILAERAASDDRVRLVTMDSLYCRNGTNPCDDRLPIRTSTAQPFATATDELARPDGSNFANHAIPAVSGALLDRIATATATTTTPGAKPTPAQG